VTIVKAVAILDIEACLTQEQLLEKDTSIRVLASTFPEKKLQLLKGV
jgi:hypothetical protein